MPFPEAPTAELFTGFGRDISARIDTLPKILQKPVCDTYIGIMHARLPYETRVKIHTLKHEGKIDEADTLWANAKTDVYGLIKRTYSDDIDGAFDKSLIGILQSPNRFEMAAYQMAAVNFLEHKGTIDRKEKGQIFDTIYRQVGEQYEGKVEAEYGKLRDWVQRILKFNG